MFHFPASTPTQTMHSSAGNTTQPVLGFPIRTSSDQRFVDNSPRHNAASHVLHRLSMPRHPPYALNNQTHYPTHTTHTTCHTTRQTACADTQNTYKRSCKHKTFAKHKNSTHTPPKQWSMERRKMLASTIQFSHNTPTPQQPHTNQCAIIHSAGQQDNHNHTNTAWLTVCCPRHPTACQHTKTVRRISCTRFATQCICHCGCASTRILKILFGGSHTLGDINHLVPQPWAQ